MITVYAVYVNADMTEGRGPMIMDKLFYHILQAEAYAATKEPYNNLGQFTQVKPIQVLDYEEAEKILALRKKEVALLAELRKNQKEMGK